MRNFIITNNMPDSTIRVKVSFYIAVEYLKYIVRVILVSKR